MGVSSPSVSDSDLESVLPVSGVSGMDGALGAVPFAVPLVGGTSAAELRARGRLGSSFFSGIYEIMESDD